MGSPARLGWCVAALALASAAGCVSSAEASVQACGLAPAASIATALGMPEVTESGSATPDTGSGGRVSECRLRAWRGSSSRARVAEDTLAKLSIETAEADVGSPFAPRWAAGEAQSQRGARKQQFEELIAGLEGYVTTTPIGPELWDRSHVDNPAFNVSGFDEIGGHGKRDIFVTWRASQPLGRSVAMEMIIDERKPAFAALNKIAEAVVTAFALTPGEFGSPPTPSPERHPHVERYRPCPGLKLRAHGSTYEHFEVLHLSCSRALAVMRDDQTGNDSSIKGWKFNNPAEGTVTARKGRARFVCYLAR
jgi:hypothetical protein